MSYKFLFQFHPKNILIFLHFPFDQQPVPKPTNVISLEQIPYTVIRLFLNKGFRDGQAIDIQEVPVILSERAIDVNVSI